MASSTYTLWLDLDAEQFVAGPNSSQLLTSLRNLHQGDTPKLVLRGLRKDEDPATTQIYKEVPLEAETIKCGVSQAIDAAPTGGTVKLKVGADVTGAITPEMTKGEIAALLNGLASVTTRGGMTVVEGGAANILVIRWNDPAESTPIEVVSNRLTPKCFDRVYFYNTPEDKYWVVKWFVAPFAFTDQFTYPLPPTVTVAMVREGSLAKNEVQALVVPGDATGEIAVKHEGLSTTVLPIASLTAAGIEAAMNGIFTDGVKRFRVSQPATKLFYVEFIGPLANTDVGLLEVDSFNQTVLPTPEARLPLTGIPLEVIQQGAASFAAFLEVVLIDGDGKESTFGPVAVTVVNDMLDSEMSLNIPNWLVSAEEAAQVTDTTVPLIYGTISWSVVIGNDVDDVWELTHNLGTLYPIVDVYSIAPYQRVPDNEYLLRVVNANKVRLTFPDAVGANSLRVVIVNAEAQTVLNNHTHPISQVEGLQGTLDEIFATFESFDIGSPLPLSMIPKLPWSWVGWADPAGTVRQTIPDVLIPSTIPRLVDGVLPISVIPPEVPRVDADGNLVINHKRPDGTTETITLYSFTEGLSTQFLEQIATQIVTSSVFTTAVITVLQGGGTLPDGTFVMAVEEVDEVLPQVPAEVSAGTKKLTMYPPLPVALAPTDVGVAVSSAGGATFQMHHRAGAPMLQVGDHIYIDGQSTYVTGVASSAATQPWSDFIYTVDTDSDVDLDEGDVIHREWRMGATITGELPTTGLIGALRTVTGIARGRQYRARRGDLFEAGTVVGWNGRFWQPVIQRDAVWYPVEMERELVVVTVTAKQLAVGRQLLIFLPLQLQLEGNTQGKITLWIEQGLPTAASGGSNLTGYTWTTLLEDELLLGTTLDFHQFGYRVHRTGFAAGQAYVTRQGVESGVGLPTGFDFAIRARLTRFDCADREQPEGALTVRMRGARASIAPVD